MLVHTSIKHRILLAGRDMMTHTEKVAWAHRFIFARARSGKQTSATLERTSIYDLVSDDQSTDDNSSPNRLLLDFGLALHWSGMNKR